MTAAIAPAAVSPASDWGEETSDEYNSPSQFAGDVAWKLLTHSWSHARDIATVMHAARPKGLEAEDMWAFVWETITEAGRIGYLAGKIDVAAFTVPGWGDDGKITTKAVARAVAALLSTPLVEESPEGASQAAEA